MFTYFLRGVVTVIAVVFTVISTGVSYLSIPAQYEEAALYPTTQDSPVKKNTTVHVLQKREDIGFSIQQAFDLYSDIASRDMRFSVQTIGNEADYNSTLRAKLLAGDGADLFQISGTRELVELEQHVRELDFLPWTTETYPQLLNAVTHDNRIYGIPYSIEGVGLICNRDIFYKAGISITDIQSFEALKKALAELNDKIVSGELKEDYENLEAVCEFPAQDNGFLSGIFADIAMTGAFESSKEAALSHTVSFPAADSVEELVKLMARYSIYGKDWPKLAEIADSRQIERFANSRVAVILQDTDVYRRVNELNSSMQGRTFLMPVPLEAYEQPSIYTGVPAYWSINAASDEKAVKAAGDFLTWLYNSPEGAEYFAAQFEAVSPYRKYAVNTGAALHSQMLSYLDAGMNLPRLYREFPQGWGKNVFAPNVRSYFTEREKTWDQAMKDSSDGWNPA